MSSLLTEKLQKFLKPESVLKLLLKKLLSWSFHKFSSSFFRKSCELKAFFDLSIRKIKNVSIFKLSRSFLPQNFSNFIRDLLLFGSKTVSRWTWVAYWLWCEVIERLNSFSFFLSSFESFFSDFFLTCRKRRNKNSRRVSSTNFPWD